MHSEIDQFVDYSSSQLHKPVRKISECHTNILIIIITFTYTAQIQLYSFQMRLTIKNLKIYLAIKDLKKNNYNVKLQHYIRKGFFKKVSLQITFKNLKIGGASKI